MSATTALGTGKARRRPPETSEPAILRLVEAVGTLVVLTVLGWQLAVNWSDFVNVARTLIPWVVVVVAADLLPVPIWGSVELMMSFPVLLAAAMVFPPYVAGVLSFLATVDRREVRREIGPLRALFNRSNVAASVLVASWVYHSFDVRLTSWPEVLVVALIALLADMLVNFTLVILGTHLLMGERVVELARHLYGGSHPEVILGAYASFGLVAVLLATVYASAGSAGLIAFAIPLFLARQMFLHWKRLGEATNRIQQKERALTVVSNRIADERREERLAIAAGIHDEILPPLFKVHLMGQVVKNDLASGRLLDLEIDVPDLVHAVMAADAALRDMIRDLRDSALGRSGLCETLRLLVRDIESRTDARVTVALEEVGGSPLTHLLAYQLAREAMTNAVRHAEPTRINLSLSQESEFLRLMVSDDGKGFDMDRVDTDSHFGLLLMRERAELAGGLLIVDSQPGRGTTVVARLPVEAERKDQAP